MATFWSAGILSLLILHHRHLAGIVLCRLVTAGTPLFRCRESRPYHEEPRLKTSFYPFLPALFLCCAPMVTLTSLPALSLQHTEVELYSGRRRRYSVSTTCPYDSGYHNSFFV